MAIRNNDVGGTDWSDGEILYAGDLNDTADEIIKRLQNTSTGHDHDGTDSKQIGDLTINSSICNFNTTTGHDHDGTSSRLIGDLTLSSGICRFNTSTGHDHDGTDSKQIGDLTINSSICNFNTSTGHDHDGTSSKKLGDLTVTSNICTFNTSTGHDHNGVNSKIVGIQQKTAEDSTEYSNVGTGYVLKKTFTITLTAPALLYFLHVWSYYKQSGANSGYHKIELTTSADVVIYSTEVNLTNTSYVLNSHKTKFDGLSVVNLDQAVYKIKYSIKGSSSTPTIYMKDIGFELYLFENIIENSTNIS